MKRCIKLLLIFICLLPFHFVLAEQCSNTEIANLKKLAETIQIDSEFMYDNVALGIYDNYIVTVNGLSEDLYVMSKDESVGFFYLDLIDGVAIKKVGASTDVFQIYSTKCSNVVLRTVDLNLKIYNQYFGSEECEGIDDLDICEEFYDGFISYDEFMKAIEDYHNKKGNISSEDVGNFLENNLYFVIAGVVIVVIIIVLLVIRNRKRSRLD